MRSVIRYINKNLQNVGEDEVKYFRRLGELSVTLLLAMELNYFGVLYLIGG